MARHLGQITGMPRLKAVFKGWTSTVVLKRITQTIVNGLRTTTEESISFNGVVQPLSVEQIQLKAEGQRSWEWLQIHCSAGDTNLKTDDLIIYNGVQFKIMGVYDYTLNGYIEYHAVKDYTA